MTKYASGLLALAAAVLLTAPVAGARSASTVTVTAGKPTEFGYIVSPKTVTHGTVTFKITNKGALPHTFKLCSKPTATATANTCAGKGTPSISPMASATLTVTIAKAGKYEYLCTITGHAAGGMKGVLTVK